MCAQFYCLSLRLWNSQALCWGFLTWSCLTLCVYTHTHTYCRLFSPLSCYFVVSCVKLHSIWRILTGNKICQRWLLEEEWRHYGLHCSDYTWPEPQHIKMLWKISLKVIRKGYRKQWRRRKILALKKKRILKKSVISVSSRLYRSRCVYGENVVLSKSLIFRY